MYPNLILEMRRTGVMQKQLAKQIGISEASMTKKMLGRTDFKLGEARIIQRSFPGKTLDWLFEKEK